MYSMETMHTGNLALSQWISHAKLQTNQLLVVQTL